jgi:hypothetical protein
VPEATLTAWCGENPNHGRQLPHHHEIRTIVDCMGKPDIEHWRRTPQGASKEPFVPALIEKRRMSRLVNTVGFV